ncbi:MAG: macro domain-containing protein [Pseudomonadota bacterium]
MFQDLAKRLFEAKPLKETLRSKPHEHIHKIRLFHGEILDHEDCDALVSFVTPDLSLGGPLNKAYLAKAGEELGDYIAERIVQPKAGEAFVVPAFNMPNKAVILAVLPLWEDGLQNEDRQMLRCYRHSIQKAQGKGIQSVAFPALGFGRLNFPHIRFARFAIKGILESIDESMQEVRIVCRDKTMSDIYATHLRKLGWSPS